MTDSPLSTADAAALLGVSGAYLRGQAAKGLWGAHKQVGERSWFFDADAIATEATRRKRNNLRNPAAVTLDPVLDTADASTWELERQLLIAQASAADTNTALAQLQAQVEIRDQQLVSRDQTIAGLQAELGRARAELARMAAFITDAAAEHLPDR